MRTPKKLAFLQAVVGVEGAAALSKAATRAPELSSVIYPRALMAWLELVREFDGHLPGTEERATFRKSEAGYEGFVMVDTAPYDFKGADVYHLAGSVAVALGADEEPIRTEASPALLNKLGKQLDLLVKSQFVQEELKKLPRRRSLMKAERLRPMQPHGHLQSEPGYVYHATAEENLPSIAEQGLLTHRPWEGTDQETWPDGSTAHRSYHSPNAGAVWHFAPEHGRPAILRTHTSKHPFQRESTGDIYSTKPISSQHMEVLMENNKWHPLAQLTPLTKDEIKVGKPKVQLPGQTAKPNAPTAPIGATPKQPKPTAAQMGVTAPNASAGTSLPKPATGVQGAAPKPGAPATKLPRPKMPGVTVTKSEAAIACGVCGQRQFTDVSFTGCFCYADLAKSVTVQQEKGSLRLSFGPEWDRDAVTSLLSSLGK